MICEGLQKTNKHTNTQSINKTNKLTNTQIHRQTNKDTNKQTHIFTNKQTTTQTKTNTQTNKQLKQTTKDKNKPNNKRTNNQTNKDTNEQTNEQTHNQTNTNTKTNKQTYTQANTQTNKHKVQDVGLRASLMVLSWMGAPHHEVVGGRRIIVWVFKGSEKRAQEASSHTLVSHPRRSAGTTQLTSFQGLALHWPLNSHLYVTPVSCSG
jgi:hypothetical protein